MRLKFLGLAASSLLLLACGEESTSSTTPPLSDAQVLAQLAAGASFVDVVGSLSNAATSSFSEPQSNAVVAARSADECSDGFNSTFKDTDDETGEITTTTLKATLANGSAITCANIESATGFKFAITMVSPSFSMAMALTVNTGEDGSMSVAGTGSGSFTEEGHSGGFSDLSFSQTLDAAGEITAYTGSMKIAFDGASTGPIAFGMDGLTAQVVDVYRNGAKIGTMTFAEDGSVVVKDASGKIISEEPAA